MEKCDILHHFSNHFFFLSGGKVTRMEIKILEQKCCFMPNITLVCCWQKQLRCRTRAGSSPRYPSLLSHRWSDASQALDERVLLFPGLPPLPCPGFIRGGEAQVPSSAPPCSLLSHLTSRKGNPGDWVGQEPQLDSHLCKQRTRPAKKNHGAHTP